ncbi:UNKNOWN [Stylonychia lemnae]|uniref:Uncharacterized protein n=1 Tax=Stylonychia lemnae TaxID=5949 RepID=A0A078AB91_STYLE|nr:UNKNOWN [Stylonychia lemnae]|eukprot:CDW79424.1 UNKNOWN [Stylonychia lemnae]
MMVLALCLKILYHLRGDTLVLKTISTRPFLSDGTVDINYGGEKLVSISAGIDGSLWALKQEENVVNYQLLKWQTSAQKWYIVSGARGINLSAYNELSVAIVDEKGLLSLSSQAGHQDEAQYTSVVGPPYNPGTGTPYTPGIGTPGTPGAPLLPIDKTITGDPNAPAIVLENPLPIAPPQLPVIIGQSPDSFVTFQTFKTFTDEVNLSFNKNIKSLTQVFTSKSNVKTRDEAMTAILNLWNIFGFIKTTSGQMIGFYYEDPQLSTSIDNQLTNTRTMIYGITNNHFSKKEFDDVFQPQFGPFPSQRYMQIIKTPRARITFYPQCFNTAPSPNVAECYSDSNFEQPAYCFWIQSKLQHDFGTFDCEQIEYYHGKSQ